MAFGGADTVAVRLTPDAPPGQAPLSLAQSAVTALRDFVVASAAGLDIRSLVLPARRPPRAEAYANEVRLSTQAGSFVMTLALPLMAAGISNEIEQEDAGTPPMLAVPRQPFGRRITRRMQSVAQRAQHLADDVNDGRQHLRTFGQVSLSDVSPNATELEALNALGGPDHELYQLRFTQSPLAGERGQPVRIDVTPGQQRVLGDAALFLRTKQPRSDVTAQGLVVRLARATKFGPGEAVVEGYADDSGSRRRYHVELVEHDYNEAYRAHGAGLQVAATGDLDIRGTHLWLRPLRAFAVIPGFEYEDDVPPPEAINPD
jgi:hypothetical protein